MGIPMDVLGTVTVESGLEVVGPEIHKEVDCNKDVVVDGIVEYGGKDGEDAESV